MILYLHGFDATSAGNHQKILQLQFIDDDVRYLNYSTLHPKHDFQFLLKEVDRELKRCDDPNPIILGVGLGGFWAERVGFLNGIRSVMINPNLKPQGNMEGKIDRPEEYADIAAKCVDRFREKNQEQALVILSRHDEDLDNKATEQELKSYYQIIWDERETHKFANLAEHLPTILAFKQHS
ncbi:alpha/beta hydrolase YcfP [Paraferrimonas sedimenticola]|uniref:UPF0227 protein n=1 Tax=Paraferrimonas sedimenticola TaxID=375674 RepID=A0AA37RRU8_9GAMM|nr:alpha/beta hydrolase YcfP [Paraferrimonas sedimenticola]GLP94890.1 UPF0227 protein [Paraferrimonas sedimenticola]